MSSKKTNDRLTTIIISLVYIALGLDCVVGAWDMTLDLLSGHFPSVRETLMIAIGVFMFLAGLFALFGVQKKVCRIFGIIIFVSSIITVVFCFTGASISLPGIADSVVKALVAWLFIACL